MYLRVSNKMNKIFLHEIFVVKKILNEYLLIKIRKFILKRIKIFTIPS